MPTFGEASKEQLLTLDPRLQAVLEDAIQYFDFTIVEGHRGEAAQTKAYITGKSKKPWPLGNHNTKPSTAADCAPYPIDWGDRPDAIRRFCYMAGFIMSSARRLNIPLRWGADWDHDDDLRDEQGLRDFPHFELLNP